MKRRAARSRIALAADRQGRYLEMHKALMTTRLLAEGVILMKAEELGLDLNRFRPDMVSVEVDRQLTRNGSSGQGTRLPRNASLRGRPRVLLGVPEDAALAAVIAAARANR